MKKIKLNEIDFNKIKEEHLKYCKKLRFKNKKNLSDKDIRRLFIENPFDENLKLKKEYQKFNKGKTKVNLTSKYERFRTPSTKKLPLWYGAKLIKALKLDICPYCGQHYFSVIKNNEGKFIAEANFDHYFPKSEYRYLALNLYNLIPVCYNCNSTYKGNNDAHIINPYFDSIEDYIHFKLKNGDISNYLNNQDIGIDIRCKNYKLAQNHINILEIKERYKYYQNMIKSVIQKRIKYSPKHIEEISKFTNYSKDFIEASLIKQDLISDNEPFLKFKSDIWEQIS